MWHPNQVIARNVTLVMSKCSRLISSCSVLQPGGVWRRPLHFIKRNWQCHASKYEYFMPKKYQTHLLLRVYYALKWANKSNHLWIDFFKKGKEVLRIYVMTS